MAKSRSGVFTFKMQIIFKCPVNNHSQLPANNRAIYHSTDNKTVDARVKVSSYVLLRRTSHYNITLLKYSFYPHIRHIAIKMGATLIKYTTNWLTEEHNSYLIAVSE